MGEPVDEFEFEPPDENDTDGPNAGEPDERLDAVCVWIPRFAAAWATAAAILDDVLIERFSMDGDETENDCVGVHGVQWYDV